MESPTPPPETLEYRRIAPAETEEQRRAWRRRLPRKVGLWIGALCTCCLISSLLLMPSMGRARPPANLVKCGSSLRQIGQACELFTLEIGNRGAFPTSLDEALRSQGLSLEIATCAQTDTTPPAYYLTTWPTAWADAMGDYVYYGRGLRRGVPSDVIVARDRSMANHAPHFQVVNVLFADGRVESLSEKELLAATEKSDRLRAQWEAGQTTKP